MKTTHESTSADDRERERREGSLLWGKTKALLDRLDYLEAALPSPDPDKLQAMKARALHAGAYRTMRLEAAIEGLVHDHRPQLVSWTGSRHSRAEWAQKQIHGEYVPGWRYIDDYLKTLSL